MMKNLKSRLWSYGWLISKVSDSDLYHSSTICEGDKRMSFIIHNIH